MKAGYLSMIAALALTGCASMSTPVKVALTPLALTRDVIEAPVAAVATFSDNYANVNRQRKDCNLKSNMFRYRGLIDGSEHSLIETAAEVGSDIFGSAAYVIGRFPFKKRPWKDKGDTWLDFFGTNFEELHRKYGHDAFTDKPYRL